MSSTGENSLGAVIFAAVAAGLLICCVWKIMWGRLREDDDGGGGGREEPGANDSGHISFAGSDFDGSGHISFVTTDDEESGSHVAVNFDHVAMSRSNSDHICMSRSTSSSSSYGYCINAYGDYQLTPRDHRAPV
jgi:hypothetical protein